MTRTAPPPIPIPAGTKPSKCSGPTCGATIYWVKTKNGKNMPVSIGGPGCSAPDEHEEGLGISHYADCPDAERFRKK